MTVNTTNITSGPYAGNDVADSFSYTFRITNKTQLKVYETNDSGIQILLTVDTDYTVSGIGNDAGGTITRVAGALPTGYEWYIRSNYENTQLSALPSQGPFFPDIHENAFDKLTFLTQQINDLVNRAFRLSDSFDIDGTFTIQDDAATRALKFLAFDSLGDLITTSGGGLSDPVSTFMKNVVAASTALTATSLLKTCYIYANKTNAVLNTPTDGNMYFIGGDDGGWFKGVEGASPGTYSDDGGNYCGTRFIPTGGDGSAAYVREFTNAADVIWFGVTGDGTTDDTNALNTALAAVQWLYIPRGNYLISSTIFLYSNTVVQGDSRGGTRIFCAVDANITLVRAVTMSNVSGEYDENIVIKDLMLDHNRLTDLTAETLMSILLVGSRKVTIDNVHFKNPNTDGIYISTDYGGTGHIDNHPEDITIKNCKFTGDFHNRNGISVIAGYDITIDNCYFEKMTRNDMPACIDLEPNTTSQFISGVNISNIYIENCKQGIGSGFGPDNLANNILNVNLNNIVIAGTPVQSGGPYQEFQGSTATLGIGFGDVNGLNINNVVIQSANSTSFYIETSKNVNVSNLNIKDARSHGIVFRDCEDINLNNFNIDCSNDIFNSVVTIGLYLRYKATGAGHQGVRKATISDGNINLTDNGGSATIGMAGLGNVRDLTLDNINFGGFWTYGVSQQNASNGKPTNWTCDYIVEADGGTHTGADNAATLTDSTKNWTVNGLVGQTIYNRTDGSSGSITANTATTITVTLSGGTDNDFDTGDIYDLSGSSIVPALFSITAGETINGPWNVPGYTYGQASLSASAATTISTVFAVNANSLFGVSRTDAAANVPYAIYNSSKVLSVGSSASETATFNWWLIRP